MPPNPVPFVKRAVERTIAGFCFDSALSLLALFLTLPEERSKPFHLLLLA